MRNKAQFAGLVVTSIILVILGTFVWAQASDGITVLEAKSFWRCRFVKGTELVRLKSGDLEHVVEHLRGGVPWVLERGGKRTLVKAPKMRRRPVPPPSDWTRPDYDDGPWGLYPGPYKGGGDRNKGRLGICPKIRLIYLRGRFRVNDPAKVGDLILSLSFEGGAVVYLNGTEVARSHLPGGKITPETPAQDYPEDVYRGEDGVLIMSHKNKKFPEVHKKRVRSLSNVKVPASLLIKGVNVLAVELHLAPAPEFLFTTKWPRSKRAMLSWSLWARVGLESLELRAPAGSEVVPGAPRGPRPKGLWVWNHPVVRQLKVSHVGDPFHEPRARLVCARNGVCSAQVVASLDRPLNDINVLASDLSGPGGARIAAASIEICWPLPDNGIGIYNGRGVRFYDTLDDAPPAKVAVDAKTGLAMQPIWIRVRVPADAVAGEYQGKVVVSAQGAESVDVPLALKVFDWTVPDHEDFFTWMDMITSPDTLAMKYGVEMWSPAHWDKVEESFRLLAQLGAKTVYIPFIAKTHFGNEHSMVRYEKQSDGSYKPDFSIAEKYMDLVVKHLGTVPVVSLYVWEIGGDSTSFPSGKSIDERTKDRPILITVRDPKTGALKEAQGPTWGTPECRKFWKTALGGMKTILAKRGLADAMMLGPSGDYYPSKAATDDLTAAAPDAEWLVHAHPSGSLKSGIWGRPVTYLACIWGQGWVADPDAPRAYVKDQLRYYGWKNPVRLARFPRNELRRHTVGMLRPYLEGCVTNMGTCGTFGPSGRWDSSAKRRWSGNDGIGRVGADFWPVLKGRRGHSQPLAGRYVPWGSLSIAKCLHHILGPGKDRPVPTARYEAWREALQENEARFFLERVLTDKAKRAGIGEALATRAQDILDERVRIILDMSLSYQGRKDAQYYICSGWQERSEQLYAIAAEVAKALGKTLAQKGK